MKLEGDLSITLEYRGPKRSGIQNWYGPGWYLTASDTDNHGEFAVEPRRISSLDAVRMAEAMGPRYGALAREQIHAYRGHLQQAKDRLTQVKAQLEATVKELKDLEKVPDEEAPST